MVRVDVQRCMEQVEAYRASGMKAKAWAAANGVPLGTLGSWCAHYGRWHAKRHGEVGVPVADGSASRPSGFVAARVAPVAASSSSVRIELSVGASHLELHWPLTNTRELAALLREFGR